MYAILTSGEEVLIKVHQTVNLSVTTVRQQEARNNLHAFMDHAIQELTTNERFILRSVADTLCLEMLKHDDLDHLLKLHLRRRLR